MLEGLRRFYASYSTTRVQAIANGIYAVLFLGMSAVSTKNGNGAGSVLCALVAVAWGWCSGVNFTRWLLTDPLEALLEQQRKYVAELQAKLVGIHVSNYYEDLEVS